MNAYEWYSNTDIKTYYDWLKKIEKKCNCRFDLCANVYEFSEYDCTQFKFDEDSVTTSFIELKSRDYPINQFDDCAIELTKIKSLVNLAAHTYNKVFLVALYRQSGKLAIWQINEDIDYPTGTLKCNKSTAAFDGEKVTKEMMFLPLDNAMIYNL